MDAPGAGVPADAPAVALPVVAGLDTALGLQRALGKPGLYAEMLRRFAQGQALVLQDIQQALAVGDVVLAERLAHTLRSVAANIGAQCVADPAQVLEQALRSGQRGEVVTVLLVPLATALQPLLQALQSWAHQAPAPRAPATAMGAAPALSAADALQKLRKLLEQDDPAATEFFQHNGPVLKSALGAAFAPVEAHTLNFDFEQALGAMAAVPGSEHPAAHAP